jgi:hypothetical protein
MESTDGWVERDMMICYLSIADRKASNKDLVVNLLQYFVFFYVFLVQLGNKLHPGQRKKKCE